jgi:hypothetical protein
MEHDDRNDVFAMNVAAPTDPFGSLTTIFRLYSFWPAIWQRMATGAILLPTESGVVATKILKTYGWII